MTDKTFHVNSEDLRGQEARESKFHGGKTPKDSDVSAMKVCSSTPIFSFLIHDTYYLSSNCCPSKNPSKMRSTESRLDYPSQMTHLLLQTFRAPMAEQ